MRLSPSRIEQTLSCFDAKVLPDNHPAASKIKELWGDHTYFLAVNGLNIVEPLSRDSGAEAGAVINVASWSDSKATSLTPHEPETTEIVVEFERQGAMQDNRPH